MRERYVNRPDGCPACNSSLYYSSDFNIEICLECMWINGDNYTYIPIGMTLEEYTTLSGILYRQVRDNKLSYLDYLHIFEVELRII
jgi:hypothetical protein